MPRTSQKQHEKVIELKLLNFTVCANLPEKLNFTSQRFQELYFDMSLVALLNTEKTPEDLKKLLKKWK